MQSFELQHQNPGFVSLLRFDDGRCYERIVGVENIATQRPISCETVFDLASVSKQFTAFCVLLLEQEGFLALTDPVGRFIPEVSIYSGDVTLQDLIHHVGGLPDFVEIALSKGIEFADELSAGEILSHLSEQKKPDFRAGDRHVYSNTGYFLLALTIERVSGVSFADYARTRIFEPLSMDNTFILDGVTQDNRVATGYIKDDSQKYTVSRCLWNPLGASLIHSSATDLMKWADNFLTGSVGGNSVIGKMLVPLASVNVREEAVIDHEDYCFGLWMDKDGDNVKFSHDGSTGGFSTYFERSLQKSYSLVILSNIEELNVEKMAAELIAEHSL